MVATISSKMHKFESVTMENLVKPCGNLSVYLCILLQAKCATISSFHGTALEKWPAWLIAKPQRRTPLRKERYDLSLHSKTAILLPANGQ